MTFRERVERYEADLDAELGAGWNVEKALLAAGEEDEPEHEIPNTIEGQSNAALVWAHDQLISLLVGSNASR